jgi:hypothetical protein
MDCKEFSISFIQGKLRGYREEFVVVLKATTPNEDRRVSRKSNVVRYVSSTFMIIILTLQVIFLQIDILEYYIHPYLSIIMNYATKEKQ